MSTSQQHSEPHPQNEAPPNSERITAKPSPFSPVPCPCGARQEFLGGGCPRTDPGPDPPLWPWVLNPFPRGYGPFLRIGERMPPGRIRPSPESSFFRSYGPHLRCSWCIFRENSELCSRISQIAHDSLNSRNRFQVLLRLEPTWRGAPPIHPLHDRVPFPTDSFASAFTCSRCVQADPLDQNFI